MDDSCIYVPDPDYYGIDSFYAIVCDMAGACDTQVFTITVNPINDAPIARNDSVVLLEDGRDTVLVILNDTDIDGPMANISIWIPPTNGTASIVGNQIIYIPTSNYNGTDSLLYIYCDGGSPNLCDTAIVYFIVLPVNDPPYAVNDSAYTFENNEVTINVLINDVNIDGDNFSVSILSGPNMGSITFDTSGNVVYTPGAGFSGTDTIIYIVCDDGIPSLCDTAIVYIYVSEVNQAPIAVNDTVLTNEDTSIGILPLQNDRDPEHGLLSLVVNSGPMHGTLQIIGDSLYYIPNENYYGSDTITYIICDNGTPILCDTAQIFITVLSVNDKPLAVNDNLTVYYGTANEVVVLSNDSDVEDVILDVTILVNPLHGTAVVTASGTVIYEPNDSLGLDSFAYVICDQGVPVLCDTAWVYLNLSVNHCPIAHADTASLDLDENVQIRVTDNDSEPDGNTLTVSVLAGPSFGEATVNADNSITYSSNMDSCGLDSFSYVICDNGIPQLCDTTEVYVYVQGEKCDFQSINIPNSFTPNGDGQNDVFYISGLDNYPDNTLKVLNRWGEVVFEAVSYQNNWDGSSRKNGRTYGAQLPDGVYFVIFELPELGISHSAYVHLKR